MRFKYLLLLALLLGGLGVVFLAAHYATRQQVEDLGNQHATEQPIVPGSPVNSAPVTSKSSGTTLKTGSWGGEHVHLETAATSGKLEFDCATGSINQAIVLDASGNFRVPGVYYQEHGGPIRQDEKSMAQSATYIGKAQGNTLTFTIVLNDSQQKIGTYTLTYGTEGQLFKCL